MAAIQRASRSVAALAAVAIALPIASASALDLSTTIPSLGTANEVVLQGTLVYVADGAGGLRIFDAANPASPVALGSIPPLAGGAAVSVSVDGAFAYVGNGTPGVQIVDVSNPLAPNVVKELNPLGPNNVVRAAGGFAYVDLGAFGLQVYDVGDPANPVARGSIGMDVNQLVVRGTLLVALTNSPPEGLRLVDVSNPDAPVQVGNLMMFTTQSLAVDGDSVWIESNDTVRRVDISNPSAPVATAPVPMGSFGENGIFVQASLLVAGGLELLDLHAFPGSGPQHMGNTSLLLEQQAEGVDQLGNLLYIATHGPGGDTTGGLTIADIQNPQNPNTFFPPLVSVGRCYAVDAVEKFGVRRAYLACHGGLFIVDVTNPAAPAVIGHFPTIDAGRAVAVDGNVAYLATQDSVLRSIDVTTPGTPTLRDSLLFSGRADDMLVRGGHVFLGRQFVAGVSIIDASDPDDLDEVASIPTTDDVYGIDLADDLLFFAASTAGFHIYNVKTPSAPVFVAAIDEIPYKGSALPAATLDVDRRFAYLAQGTGAAIVDLRDPIHPTVVNDFALLQSPSDLRASGGRLYSVTGSNLFGGGVFVDDISLPGRPGIARLTAIDAPGTTKVVAIDFSSGVVAVASGTSGTSLVDATGDLAGYPCIDGIDNDGDALVDADIDTGCSDGADPSELPACSDGLDNDGDALIDFPADPGCGSTLSAQEDPQCQDGLDNDGDGAIDHPADTRCSSARDDDEVLDSACGLLGIEPLLALVAARWLRTRRGRAPQVSYLHELPSEIVLGRDRE